MCRVVSSKARFLHGRQAWPSPKTHFLTLFENDFANVAELILSKDITPFTDIVYQDIWKAIKILSLLWGKISSFLAESL